ncbi:helix-turn-helix domain-containing protein [Streptomyces sp. TLI_171]|uniref:helix-turn-helix domain-containing protein n=1 Tax=Streptomyces sp. TLI_171 TaxID=1938859 RepID=UPI000C60F06C|nr:helix-turn-helix transcriptional regulator [Streptomyces sp. TLI_171]RKE02978.1 transcriptional regulator with XRE-family HTH domain [Streptomyces sp. TLI_171]
MGTRGIAHFDPAALRTQRRLAGLSQDQLAAAVRAGSLVLLHRTHVSMYESGRRLPEQRTLCAMASCLGISASVLLRPAPLSIARIRLDADLTQSQTAERIGVPQSQMSLIERGMAELDPQGLSMLATALGTTVEAVRLALHAPHTKRPSCS